MHQRRGQIQQDVASMNESSKLKHEEHIADRGYNSTSLSFLVHLPIPILKAMTISEATVAVDREWDLHKKCQLGKHPK